MSKHEILTELWASGVGADALDWASPTIDKVFLLGLLIMKMRCFFGVA